ncbi:MAG: thiamine-phosphate kinase, partial [bacterium]|nr:thiamine-phosphate kinase [bacterium]
LYRGLIECSQACHCPLVGGDTNLSQKGWVVSVTVTGYTGRSPKLRSGAKAGDSLWVTGTFGGAALGWEAWRKKDKSRTTAVFRKKHSRPEPRLLWGQRLGENPLVSAMIDCSDGLASDLQHLAEASGVAMELEVDEVPRLPGFEKAARRLKANPLDLLLGGGEDYELIFTLAPEGEADMSEWLQSYDICAKRVGRVRAGKGVRFLQSGQELKKTYRGFSHF